MLTSAKNGKQNGDTRTRKPEPGYLNLSNVGDQTRLAIHLHNHYYRTFYKFQAELVLIKMGV
jgi:hypothetical protein